MMIRVRTSHANCFRLPTPAERRAIERRQRRETSTRTLMRAPRDRYSHTLPDHLHGK